MAHDHDDDHGSPLTETQLRVRALESLRLQVHRVAVIPVVVP